MKRQIWLLPALAVFLLGGISDITLPGIYMDAVNPDYMVIRILHAQTIDAPVWSVPGNLLLGRFPVLGQVYHGALSVYVGLPAYAVFGTGVIGIRLTNLWFGVLVLAAVWSFLRAFRVPPPIAVLALTALAADPGFLFDFRTQFYLLVLPLAPLLAGIALTEFRRGDSTPASQTLAGALAGIACYGYFIYGFLIPAAFGHAVWSWRHAPDRHRRILRWSIGFSLGVAPYAVGFVLLAADAGGLSGVTDFVGHTLGAVHPADPALRSIGRLHLFLSMTRTTVLAAGPTKMILGTPETLIAPLLKLTLLLGLPAMALMFVVLRRRQSVGLLVLAGMLLGMLALVLSFGDRLWLHHTALLLPVLYAALALALHIATVDRARAAAVLALLVLAPLTFCNVIDQQILLQRLRATGGVGLASDALDHFAEDMRHAPMPMRVFLPDWGVFMPFAMITGGRVPYSLQFSADAARKVLCSGTDAVLALVASQPSARLDVWTTAMGWGEPMIRTYAQRDGSPVLRVARWRAMPHPAGAACSAAGH